MYARTHWHSEGLRWIAGLITGLADFMDRRDATPSGRAAMSASEACDEARARVALRVPYY